MNELPTILQDAVRQEVQRRVARYAPSWAQFSMLYQAVWARCELTLAEREFLSAVLPVLARLRPCVWMHCREILALAIATPGADGEALRAACAPYLERTGPDAAIDARALGQLMKRAVGFPFGGYYVERVEGEHRRDSALVRVVSCAGLMP